MHTDPQMSLLYWQDGEEAASSGGGAARAAGPAGAEAPSEEENLQMLDTMMQDPNIQVRLRLPYVKVLKSPRGTPDA